MSLAGNSWCPSQITFLSWDLKGGSCVCLGIVVAVTTFDWPCCRLVVTSEPLDLDLNAARRGAVWWKRRCSICCASCAQSFSTVMQHSGFNWSSWNTDLSYFKEGFSLKKTKLWIILGIQTWNNNIISTTAVLLTPYLAQKKGGRKNQRRHPRLKISGRLCVVNLHCWRVGFLGCYPWGAELPDVAMTIKYSRESKNPSKAGLRFLNLPKTFFVKERNRTQPQNSEITFIPFLIHHFNHVFPDYGWTHTHTQIDAGYSEYLSHHTRTFGHLGIWLPWIDALLRPARLRVWISECDLDGQEW